MREIVVTAIQAENSGITVKTDGVNVTQSRILMLRNNGQNSIITSFTVA